MGYNTQLRTLVPCFTVDLSQASYSAESQVLYHFSTCPSSNVNVWTHIDLSTEMWHTTRPTRREAFFLSDSGSGRAAFEHPGHVIARRYRMATGCLVSVELSSIRYTASFDSNFFMFNFVPSLPIFSFCPFSFCPYDVRINTPVAHTTRPANRCSGHVTARRWWKCLLLV